MNELTGLDVFQSVTNRSHNPDLILKERSSQIFPDRRGRHSQISDDLDNFCHVSFFFSMMDGGERRERESWNDIKISAVFRSLYKS